MSDEEHPEISEIDRMLDIAADKLQNGFEVVFEISRYDAEILLDTWDNAIEGDVLAVGALLAEMGKLVDILTEQMEDP